jgi:hypothetical protein
MLFIGPAMPACSPFLMILTDRGRTKRLKSLAYYGNRMEWGEFTCYMLALAVSVCF